MALMLRILLLMVIATLVTGKNLPDNDPGSAGYYLNDDSENDAAISPLYDAENPVDQEFDTPDLYFPYDAENDPGSG